MRVNTDSLILKKRLQLQEDLDASKTQHERNKLGQFATPPPLATEIIKATQEYIDSNLPLRFLDPAFGTGAFFVALREVMGTDSIERAQGIEIDPHYGIPAQHLWRETNLNLILADFTQLAAPHDEQQKANLIVCNPPYVRHHHIDAEQKAQLKAKSKETTGIQLSGLAGLYCYFMFIAHDWMAKGGIGCWLIPSELLAVNYGRKVKQYLLTKVQLLRIHRFDPSDRQFENALVSSSVVWFRNERPDPEDTIELTFGGTLKNPTKKQIVIHKRLNANAKWSRMPLLSKPKAHLVNPKTPNTKVSNLFRIKRGIATGANKFFILTPDQITAYNLPSNFLVPILPSPRYLDSNQILSDEYGNPSNTKSLFLLNCRLPEHEVRAKHPTLWEYLELGKRQDIHKRYLCRHRSPWYMQESRPPAPILCTYMGRNQQPFKFILNQSKATAPNVYLMLYPKPDLQIHIEENPKLLLKIWNALRDIKSVDLISEGRVYGGGLYKLEPKELGNTSLETIGNFLPEIQSTIATQPALF